MHLETEEGDDIENPSDDQVRQAVRALGKASGTFAILTRREEPLEYIQTTGEENAFIVEYHENDRHFRAIDGNLALEKTEALLLAYRRGGDAWRTMTTWQDVTKEGKGGEWTARIIIAVIVLIVLVAVIVKFLV